MDRLGRDGRFAAELLDLRAWPLPFFQETRETAGDLADPLYSDPLVRRWNRIIARAEAYLFITPEYTHGLPAVVKNAVDTVFLSWAFRNKPAGFVSYSGGIAAGARAVEQLALTSIEAELAPLRNAVLIPFVDRAFADDGSPTDPVTEHSLRILLDDLAWWTAALQNARARGELPPAALREFSRA
jgi:NAD(P)H-dependent FMN reductase